MALAALHARRIGILHSAQRFTKRPQVSSSAPVHESASHILRISMSLEQTATVTAVATAAGCFVLCSLAVETYHIYRRLDRSQHIYCRLDSVQPDTSLAHEPDPHQDADRDKMGESPPLTPLLQVTIDIWQCILERLELRDRVRMGSICNVARSHFLILRSAQPTVYSPPRMIVFETILNEGDLTIERAFDTVERVCCALKSRPRPADDVDPQGALRGGFARERQALGHLRDHPHPFLTRLACAYSDDDRMFLATPFVRSATSSIKSCSLENVFVDQDPMAVARARFYAAEIALALEHMHAHSLIHHNLLVEHVLLGAEGHAVLIGMGAAERRNDVYEMRAGTLCGTPECMAPEKILSRPYNAKVDFWSLGCVLYELLNGGHGPFGADGIADLIRNILTPSLIAPPAAVAQTDSMSAHACITALLTRDVEQRAGPDLRYQSFFAGMNWDELPNTPAPIVPV